MTDADQKRWVYLLLKFTREFDEPWVDSVKAVFADRKRAFAAKRGLEEKARGSWTSYSIIKKELK